MPLYQHIDQKMLLIKQGPRPGCTKYRLDLLNIDDRPAESGYAAVCQCTYSECAGCRNLSQCASLQKLTLSHRRQGS